MTYETFQCRRCRRILPIKTACERDRFICKMCDGELADVLYDEELVKKTMYKDLGDYGK